MNKKARCLMIQGTTSDAGKTAIVTGLCRILSRRGIKVAPFKPQNMALNSAVTSDGGEIGRAQALQAQACGLEPHTDMNPILLKPNTDIGAQVIIHGKAKFNMDARSYHDYKKTAMQAVLESYQRLALQYDVIIVEGAGSPAEINLREHDIANMGFAEAVDCPVFIVADIDKGGVFAHLYGTLALLSKTEKNRVKGFIINKFRGDIKLLLPGNKWLEEKTGKDVLGVLPYLHYLHLDAEDAISNKKELNKAQENSLDSSKKINIIVPILSRISNHTDFEPLQQHPQVNFQFVPMDKVKIPAADLIILPGSKNVRRDLALLIENGWQEHIQKHLRYGGKLMGICGGYQMLGHKVDDPLGIEGAPGSTKGFGLLNCETCLEATKQLRQTKGFFLKNKIVVQGYEIHSGITTKLLPQEQDLLHLADDRLDGILSDDNQIMGCYLHGLFELSQASQHILQWAGLSEVKAINHKQQREDAINLMADTLEQNLDFTKINSLL